MSYKYLTGQLASDYEALSGGINGYATTVAKAGETIQNIQLEYVSVIDSIKLAIQGKMQEDAVSTIVIVINGLNGGLQGINLLSELLAGVVKYYDILVQLKKADEEYHGQKQAVSQYGTEENKWRQKADNFVSTGFDQHVYDYYVAQKNRYKSQREEAQEKCKQFETEAIELVTKANNLRSEIVAADLAYTFDYTGQSSNTKTGSTTFISSSGIVHGGSGGKFGENEGTTETQTATIATATTEYSPKALSLDPTTYKTFELMDRSIFQTSEPSTVNIVPIASSAIASPELTNGTSISSNSGLKPKKETSQEKVDFANSAYQKALEIESEYGIPAQITFAQACLETGYGKSFTGKNNIFNIKDYSGDSKSTRATVLEYDSSGRRTTENSYFKGYDSVDSSYEDYASLLKRKYQPTNGNSVDDWFTSIKKNGYATDPNYIKSLKGVLDYWGVDY